MRNFLATMTAMDIGKVIRQLRVAKGLTLEELAHLAEMDAGNLSRIERGKQRYSPATLEKIAAALGIPIYQLYQESQSVATAYHLLTEPQIALYDVPTPFLRQYAKLTPNNQELISEMVRLLLKHQQ